MCRFKVFLWIQVLLLCASCGKSSKASRAESVEANASVVAENQKDSADERADSRAVSMLKEFYSIALGPGMRTGEELQRDNAKYFTKAMRDKIRRMTWDSDANPVIRAQDVPQDSCETLRIEPLGCDWYMVRYVFGKGTPYEEATEIPVKVVEEDGACRIGYITPESLGQAHNDSLWYSGDAFPEVDRAEPLAFVKSFYDLYTLKHSTLSDDLLRELSTIRTEYLTSAALSRFDKMEELSRGDGYPEYDALIGRHDFEYPYRNDVWVRPTDEANTFQVGVTGDTILIHVVKREGKCYIDGIDNKEFDSFLPVE